MRRNICHSVTEISYPSLDDIKSVQNLVISTDWTTGWSHSFSKDLINQSTSQSVSHSVSKSVTQYVNQSVSLPASQPVSQSVISQLASQSFSQSVFLSVRQSVSQPVSQSVNDFGQKLQISFSFVLGKNRPWSSVHYLVRKQVVLDYKILILNSGHIGISQRGQPMILVKKWKLYHTLH